MAGSTKIFSSFTTTFVSRVQLNIPAGRLGWHYKYSHNWPQYCILVVIVPHYLRSLNTERFSLGE